MLRVVDTQKPIERQINSQNNIDKLAVLLGHWLKQAIQVLNYLSCVQIALVLTFETAVLVKRINDCFYVHKVHFDFELVLAKNH